MSTSWLEKDAGSFCARSGTLAVERSTRQEKVPRRQRTAEPATNDAIWLQSAPSAKRRCILVSMSNFKLLIFVFLMTLSVIIALSVLQRSICGAGVSRIFMTASPDLLLLPPSLHVMSNFCGLFLIIFIINRKIHIRAQN